MKFWELASAFREEPALLLEVLKQPIWRKYYNNFLNLDEIVEKQKREILDEEIPFDLSYEVAEKSKTEYWLSFDKDPQILYNYKPNIEKLERLLPGEILVRFGGHKLEEAHEYSSTAVNPRPLNNEAEVIGSYNLTSIGLLAILRTEKTKLPNNSILSTQDMFKSWLVLKVDFTLGSPYSYYEKLQAQNEQRIYLYILKGNNNEKPKPGTLLIIS